MATTEIDPTNVIEKRVRKSIQRLSEVYDKDFEAIKERKVAVIEGSGVKLGDIERVKDAYQRAKVDKEMSKHIHHLCYKTVGQANKRNGDVKRFTGFDKNDENEVVKRIAIAEKINLDSLKLICDLFNVPTTGKQKKDIATMLVDFIKCPIETGSKSFRTVALRPKTKSKNSKKKEKVTKDKKKELSKDVDMEDSENVSEADSLSEIDNEEILPSKKESNEKNNEDKVITPKKKRAEKKIAAEMKIKEVKKKKETKTKEKKETKTKGKKETKTKGKKETKTKEKILLKDAVVADRENLSGTDSLSEIDSDEILPQKKRSEKDKKNVEETSVDEGKEMSETVDAKEEMDAEDQIEAKYDLSDDNFKSKIFDILKGADLNSTTLNQVCDSVTAQFPDVDLMAQRHHIKQLVKKVIDES